MMTRTLRLSASLACALFVAGCQSYPGTPVQGPAATSAASRDGAVLTGRVQLPGYTVLTPGNDVRTNASVTLYDGRTPVAAGLTDATGAFTLYKGPAEISTEVGHIFTLEVTKRSRYEDQKTLLSMRTLVRKTASGFTSITGDTITISALTTALTALATEERVAADALIGIAVDGLADDAVVGTYTGTLIRAQSDVIASTIRDNVDPVQNALGTEYVGNVTITNPDDLARFSHTARIDGDLTIAVMPGEVEVVLPYLQEVTGDLTVTSVAEETDLIGLSFMRRVGGSLIISAPSLTSVNGLEGLTEIGKNLRVKASGGDLAIASLSGLQNIGNLGGKLELTGLPQLTALPAFASLTSVGDLIIGGTGLTNLDGLSALTAIVPNGELNATAGITVTNNSALTNLDGLENLVGNGQPEDTAASLHELHVVENVSLTSLSGLSHTIVNGTKFELIALPQLTSLAGPAVGLVDDLSINDCDMLTTFDSLITTPDTVVARNVTFAGNALLTSIGSSLSPLKVGIDHDSFRPQITLMSNCALGMNAGTFLGALNYIGTATNRGPRVTNNGCE